MQIIFLMLTSHNLSQVWPQEDELIAMVTANKDPLNKQIKLYF